MPTRAELFARKNRIIALYRAGRGMQEIDNLLGLYGGCAQKTLRKWAPEIIRDPSDAAKIGCTKRPQTFRAGVKKRLHDPWADENLMRRKLEDEQNRSAARAADYQTRGLARSR